MVNLVSVGIGAGLASALLFGVVVTGSPLGILLSYVAPLPIFIAALGWNHRSGLLAAMIGGLATALAFRVQAGVAFVLGSALPGWWLAYLALLGRPVGDGRMEWYPLGRLLAWMAMTAALITVVGVVALGAGDYEDYRQALRRALEGVLRLQGQDPPGSPSAGAGAPTSTVLDGLITFVPFLASAVFTFILALNLWIAAKAVAISDRLPRPWPEIASARMPRFALVLLFGSTVSAFLPALIGIVGLSLAGGLVMAFALQGLALLHDVSRGRPGRGALLGATYALALLIGHTALPLLAIAGAVDTAFDLRSRLRPGGAGPRSPT